MIRPRALALLVLCGLVGSACGGSDDPSPPGARTSETGTRVTDGVVDVLVPEGWVSKEADVGLILAGDRKNLRSAAPTGPRMSLCFAVPDRYDPEQLLDALAAEEVAVEGESEPVTVDGRAGLAIETRRVRDGVAVSARVIVVTLDSGKVCTLFTEAPADQFESHRATFDEIVESVRFVASSPTPAPS